MIIGVLMFAQLVLLLSVVHLLDGVRQKLDKLISNPWHCQHFHSGGIVGPEAFGLQPGERLVELSNPEEGSVFNVD